MAKKKTFMVVGLGRFGSAVATTLYELGYDVLAIDDRQEEVEAISGMVTEAVTADATDPRALAELGVEGVDVAIVAIGTTLHAATLVTLELKELNVPVVVTKAHSELHARVLKKIGADKVVLPERDMGQRVAHQLAMGSLVSGFEMLPDHAISEMEVPARWEGKSIKELNTREKYGVNIIAIRRGDVTNIVPGGADVLKHGDIIAIAGLRASVERITDA